MYKTALIKKPRLEDDQVRYRDGLTVDIIETVLYADTKAAWYTQLFAPTLKKKTLIETCKNIWHFVKSQIPYKLDPEGQQWIKSPGRLWQDRSGDCKSFSIFTGSCLRNLGIPYGYRFSSYSSVNPQPTHVYVYVPLANGKEIILDSVWTGPFNTEKKYTYKQDKLMSRISYLGSVGKPGVYVKPAHVPGVLILTKNFDQISEGEMDLLLARQRLEIEKENSAAVGGPFNWQIEKYDKAIGIIQNALDNVDNPGYIEGIGNNMINKAKKAGKKKSGGGFFKKIGKGISKGLKTVTKVVTAPARIIAKGILELYIPKAAMMFLYLFAEEKMLTDKMKAKRKKAEKFKNFIVKKIGMKEKHLMGIIRNSLTKKLKTSPESFLAKGLKSVAVIKGIGDIGNQKKLKVNKQKNKKSGLQRIPFTASTIKSSDVKAVAPIISRQNLQSNFAMYQTQANDSAIENRNMRRQNNVDAAKGLATSLATGDPIGAIMAAINWIISKLGGKKEGVDLSAKDIPNIAEDAGNAFNYGDLKEDYSNVPEQVKEIIKEKATAMIDNDLNYNQALVKIQNEMPSLNYKQQQEIAREVAEGYEPIEEGEANESAAAIKNQRADTLPEMEKTGGRSGPGMCNC